MTDRIAPDWRSGNAMLRGRLLAAGAETLAVSTDRDWVLDTLAFAARRRRDRRMSPLTPAQTARPSGAS